MYIQNGKSSRNGKSYPSSLLCRKYRKDGVVKTEVVMNLNKLPPELVLAITNAIKKDKEFTVSTNDITIEKAFDYGFVFAVIAMMNELRIPETLEKTIGGIQAKLSQLLIIGKIITRGCKLSIFNWIHQNPEVDTKLGIDLEVLKLQDLYDCLENLSNLQNKIERKWNVYHKVENEIFLYDITSSYFEGFKNELSDYGYNRDEKRVKNRL